jgi:outer membrane lipoprotein carrier protein
MLKTTLRILFLAAAAMAPVAHAGSAQDALKRFADGVKTFEAHFEQVQTDDHDRITGSSSGQFLLSRPGASANADKTGKFRWAYEKPYEQLTVCDGDKLWSYDPDLEQVTVRSAHQALAGTPAALLSQKTAFSDAFNVQDAGAEGELHIVKLTPKSKDSDFKSIELALNKDGAPVRMRFADQIGGHSEVTFSAIRTNGPIDAAQFRFTPPKGTEVVDADAAPEQKTK